jgi:hypothetical protein
MINEQVFKMLRDHAPYYRPQLNPLQRLKLKLFGHVNIKEALGKTGIEPLTLHVIECSRHGLVVVSPLKETDDFFCPYCNPNNREDEIDEGLHSPALDTYEYPVVHTPQE